MRISFPGDGSPATIDLEGFVDRPLEEIPLASRRGQTLCSQAFETDRERKLKGELAIAKQALRTIAEMRCIAVDHCTGCICDEQRGGRYDLEGPGPIAIATTALARLTKTGE